MRIEELHIDGDRYFFDFQECPASKGWAQIDTEQDASYFGGWANPKRLIVVNFCEGEVTIKSADTTDEFKEELRWQKKWNDDNEYKFAIDCMCRNDIRDGFVRLGLEDLLH